MMLDFLKKLIEPDNQEPIDRDQQTRLAAAVLLIEVAAIDDNFQAQETSALLQILAGRFKLSDNEVAQLRAQAESARAEASSLHEHTRVINDQFTPEQKTELIANMWQIAYADGEIDKYEEYIIRRVSDLIYVPHNDFIYAKQWARQQTEAGH